MERVFEIFASDSNVFSKIVAMMYVLVVSQSIFETCFIFDSLMVK